MFNMVLYCIKTILHTHAKSNMHRNALVRTKIVSEARAESNGMTRHESVENDNFA